MMATIRTFLKRTVGQHSVINNNIDSSSDTSSSITDRSNNQTNDGYNSTSTLGILTVNSDDSLQRPLLNVHTTNRRKKFFSCIIDNTMIMNNQQEQLIDENNICLLDKKLPKELVLR